jgi:hypothetical protein
MFLDQVTDAVGIIGLVRQHDGARAEVVEQRVGDLPIMRLAGGQAEPDREPLRINDDVDLCREPAPAATETMICTPPFCRRGPVGLSIIWMSPSCAAVMASISRSHTPAFRHRTKRL